MDTVYRIYTEDADRAAVIAIVNANEEDVEEVGRGLCAINGQKSVLVMGLTGRAKRLS